MATVTAQPLALGDAKEEMKQEGEEALEALDAVEEEDDSIDRKLEYYCCIPDDNEGFDLCGVVCCG